LARASGRICWNGKRSLSARFAAATGQSSCLKHRTPANSKGERAYTNVEVQGLTGVPPILGEQAMITTFPASYSETPASLACV